MLGLELRANSSRSNGEGGSISIEVQDKTYNNGIVHTSTEVQARCEALAVAVVQQSRT